MYYNIIYIYWILFVIVFMKLRVLESSNFTRPRLGPWFSIRKFFENSNSLVYIGIKPRNPQLLYLFGVHSGYTLLTYFIVNNLWKIYFLDIVCRQYFYIPRQTALGSNSANDTRNVFPTTYPILQSLTKRDT